MERILVPFISEGNGIIDKEHQHVIKALSQHRINQRFVAYNGKTILLTKDDYTISLYDVLTYVKVGEVTTKIKY